MTDLPTNVQSPDGETVVGASAELLVELLDAYFDELEKMGAPVRSHLAPGLAESEIRDLLATQGLVAPDELVAWYGAFDGPTFPDNETPFYAFPNFEFHSLQTAINLREIDRQATGFGDEVWQFDKNWLRLGGASLSLAVRCTGSPSAAPLVCAIGDGNGTNGDDPHQVVSLCTPVVWWIEALRAGRFLWDADRRRWQFPPSPVAPGQLTRRVLRG